MRLLSLPTATRAAHALLLATVFYFVASGWLTGPLQFFIFEKDLFELTFTAKLLVDLHLAERGGLQTEVLISLALLNLLQIVDTDLLLEFSGFLF